MTLYEDVHDEFMRLRTVSDVMNRLDPCTDKRMELKINRLNYLNSLPADLVERIPCFTCKSGELCNTGFDPVYVCSENPMRGLVTDFCDRYVGNPWPQDTFELNPIQLKIIVLALASPSLGVLASRGVGKSVALALIIIIWCFFCAKGEDVFSVAPTTMMTDKIYSYVVDFMAAGKNNLLMVGDPSIGYEGVDGAPRFGQKPQIKWKQGTSFRPACASNTNHGKTMRGQQPTFEIIDESSYIGDEIYYRTLKAGMGSTRSDHENIMIESGTPDMKNHFYDMFYDERKFGHYIKVRFDFEDGIRHGRYTRDAIDKLMAEAGGYDSEEFKSEYRCIFPESVTSFFKSIDHAFSNAMIELSPMPGMHYVAGLDLGRINDSTILSIGRYEVTSNGDRVDVVHLLEINPGDDVSYPVQCEMIIEELRKWKVQSCYVDATGPGIPIYEQLKAVAQQKNLNTNLYEFKFTGANKYPEFMRLRTLFQVSPDARLRYPNIKYESLVHHPDYNNFVKAEQEFRDIVQRRTNSSSETGKYKVEPSKTKGHDDYVASCICLAAHITDNYNNEMVAANVHSNDRLLNRESGRMGGKVGGIGGKRFNSKRTPNIWRQI